MFKCKVCLEKDKRIADMQAEILHLRDLTNPGKLTVQLPDIQREADQIMSGGSSEQQEDIESEASRLLSATY